MAAKKREDEVHAEKAAKYFEELAKQGKSEAELISLGKTTMVKG